MLASLQKGRDLKEKNINYINKLNIKKKLKNISSLKSLNTDLPLLSNTTKQKDIINNNNYKAKNTNKYKKITFYTPRTLSKFTKFNSLSPKIDKRSKNDSLHNIIIMNNNSSKIDIYNKSLNKTKFNNSSCDNKNKMRSYKPSKKFNFSKYFYKSQSNLYSSKRIFRHYIHESENDIIIPEKLFHKWGAPKHKKEIDELYKINLNFHQRIQEIKSNKTIAYKKDFNILSYQATLLKLLSKNIHEKNLNDLQRRYINFNQKNFGMGIGGKGRFTNLAEKIKYNVPLFLYESIKKLDEEKLKSRYNYFKRISENIHKNFEKNYYKSHKKIEKKLEEKSDSKEKENYNKRRKNNYKFLFSERNYSF